MIDISQQGYTHEEVLKILVQDKGIDKSYFKIEVIRDWGHICWVDFTELSFECDADSAVKHSGAMTIINDDRINWRKDFLRPVMFLPYKNTVLRFDFVPLKPITISDNISDNKVRRIEAYDESIFLKDNSIGESILFPKDTPYLAVISDVITQTGFENLSITPSEKYLAAEREFEAGEERLELVNTLLQEINFTTLEMHYDGRLYSYPYEIPSISNARIQYDAKDGIILQEKTLEQDSYKRYNEFIGYCANPDMENDLRFSFVNTSPASPTSTVNLGYKITAPPRQYNNVPDEDTLGDLVLRWAAEVDQSYRYATITTKIMPHHEVGEVIKVKSDGVDGIWLENRWRIDVNNRTMQHDLRSVYG